MLDPDLDDDGKDAMDSGSNEDNDFDWTCLESYGEPLLGPLEEEILVLPDVVLDLESKRVGLALVESGAFAHVCPASFAADCPIQSPVRQLNVRTASGQKIKHLGTKHVTFRDVVGGAFDIDFEVC